MSPNEKNIEKLIKRIVKQQPVDISDLLLHWRGLSSRGDRIVINTLNRQNGWETFLLWSESEPDVRSLMKNISDRAGISEAGMLVLKAAGLASSNEDTERSQALWILQTVRSDKRENWDRAAESMLQNEDFFEGTLSLLETEETVHTAEFLSDLLNASLTREQDQAVRKTLYRFRQKGIQVAAEEKGIQISADMTRDEIFLLAQNRLPLWQPFFYYSRTGARGDWFFAEISEGKNFEIVQQQRGVRMNQKEMIRIANNYAAHFEQGTGVPISFLSVSPMHARYFIEASFRHVKGAEDFRRYMGTADQSNPFEDWDVRNDLLPADAQALLSHEFFILWMMEDDFLAQLFERIKQIEEGPIILPEQQRKQQRLEAQERALEDYFQTSKREIWALALEKAAYALKESDLDSARLAVGFARMLIDVERSISSIPFASALLDRSLEIHEKQQAKQKSEEKKTSLIMSPQEFERSMKKN